MSSALRTSPWRRAPRLLRHHPAVLAAVLGGVAVLSAAAAARPLFVATSGDAVLRTQVEARCPGAMALSLDQAAAAPAFDHAVRRAIAGQAELADPVVTFAAPVTADVPAGDRRSPLTLMSRTGALDHIERLRGGGPADGAWVTEGTASRLGLAPGEVIHLRGTDATVPVAGVYRDLRPALLADPGQPFWCSRLRDVVPRGDYGDAPPPLALVPPATFARVAVAAGVRTPGVGLDGTWEVPVEVSGRAGARRATRTAEMLPSAVTRALDRAGVDHRTVRPVRSDLGFVTDRSDAVAATIDGAVAPVAAAGLVTAALLVAAAGSYWVDRRRDELTMLGVRGAGPVDLGVKAGLEALVPAAAGAIVGWALAIGLVAAVGPAVGDIAPGPALARAALTSGLASVAGLLVLSTTAGARTRDLGARRTRGSSHAWRRRVPWEAVPLALAWAAHRRLVEVGAPVTSGTGVPRLDVAALAFPLLLIVGLVGLAARVAIALLRRLRDRGGRLPTGLYLAARRLGSAPHLAVVLLAASATGVGVLVYAGALSQTLSTSLDLKARTALGSDTVIEPRGSVRVPTSLRDRVTVVSRVADVQLSTPQIDILAVDPATFARAVHWDPSFADDSLDDLLGELGPRRADGTLPAVVVNGPLPGDGRVDFVDPRYGDLALAQQGTARSFPGASRYRPMAVIDRRALAGLPNHPVTEVWARGATDGTVESFQGAGTDVRFHTTVDTVLDQSSFLTITWTFGFMEALGVLVSLITVCGMLLYLDTRQRSRRASYVLLRRMGLSRPTHRRSLLAEVGAVLVAGTALGAAFACLAAALVTDHVDPLPGLLPGPLLHLPTALVAAVLVGAVVMSGLGAFVAQGTADRADPAQVLRAE